MKRRPIQDRLAEYTSRLVETYADEMSRAHNLDQVRRLPSPEKTTEVLLKILEVLYPGFYGNQHLTRNNVAYHAGALLDDIADELDEQIYLSSRFVCPNDDPCDHCAQFADAAVEQFIGGLPDVRRALALDVQAAFDGDPAAKSFAEIILAYPGLEAVSIYRIAHELTVLDVQLLPRIMTEYAHRKTGIDIHPGAKIGNSFFIDHGTGVVVGETTDIGSQVKIYQGVTLGALSFPKDERGNLIRGRKRHPTIEDEVVIYAGATILGGDTVIGKGSVIGGNTWVTHSIPPYSRVLSTPQEQRIEPGGNGPNRVPSGANRPNGGR
ncbi:MAG: serine O-acetyltransferase EpsC [Candidatus Eisenbacteria bacterium]|nr:serine acetyltransferase [Candidatus Eisenbacteria bacterium]